MTKYNAFDQNQLDQLSTMLPSSPENVKLLLELDAVASQYGMVLQNVKINDPNSSSVAGTAVPVLPGQPAANPSVGTLTIDFSVAGSYDSFTSFIKTIERSLRVIDIKKVTFSALDAKSQTYQYTVSIQTYWLK